MKQLPTIVLHHEMEYSVDLGLLNLNCLRQLRHQDLRRARLVTASSSDESRQAPSIAGVDFPHARFSKYLRSLEFHLPLPSHFYFDTG